MELKEHIKQIAEKHLPDESYFLVDVVLKGIANSQKVIILIDGDNGVDIDACANVSRAVAAEFEVEDPFPDRYTLEVSSPGLDHPLTLARQYQSRLGKTLKLTMNDGEIWKGKLVSAVEDKIVIEKEIKQGKKQITEETEVPLADISKAMVVVSFK